MIATAALAVAAVTFAAEPAPPKFEIKDGDRIVWIGGAVVEREQRYGYWETALHAAFPDKNFTLRNLGWSGDTVGGESRARFDFNQPDAGFKQLVDLTLELKPTVIFISYGANESFEGEAGLEKFERGLEKLLDALKPAKARVVLFTPMPVCAAESPTGSPDPAVRNEMIARYVEVVESVGGRRELYVANLHRRVKSVFNSLKAANNLKPNLGGSPQMTANGTHLTGKGYIATQFGFLDSLGHPVDMSRYGEQIAKLEPLRRAIVAKNQLFFYRWRPQNETYLFGFRKHEQGKNAKEVAEYDPLVAKAEDEIAKLKKSLRN